MAEYGHNYQLAAMHLTGPPIREMFTSLGPNPTGVADEVNPSVLELLHGKQFKGEEGEDPYQHLQFFEDVCGTFKLNAFSPDDMKLKLFPHTLAKETRNWLVSHPAGTFDTWSKLAETFLSDFYPEKKSYEARRRILNFRQRPRESLVNAYQRYKFLLNDFPHHKLPEWLVLNLFYGGLQYDSKEELDLASASSFITSKVPEAFEVLEGKLANHEAWGSNEEEEGKVEVDFDCIKAYLNSGRVKQISNELYLDPDVVLRFVQSYVEHMEFPKRKWRIILMRIPRKGS
jgi:hypothetical protein